MIVKNARIKNNQSIYVFFLANLNSAVGVGLGLGDLSNLGNLAGGSLGSNNLGGGGLGDLGMGGGLSGLAGNLGNLAGGLAGFGNNAGLASGLNNLASMGLGGLGSGGLSGSGGLGNSGGMGNSDLGNMRESRMGRNMGSSQGNMDDTSIFVRNVSLYSAQNRIT